jgi:hypothetical protein
MRGAGISGAGIEGDLGGIEDVADDGEAPIQGSEGDSPETATGDSPMPGGGANAEQTI